MLLNCPHCGTKNRIDPARLNDRPQCGRCAKQILEGAPVTLDASSFDVVIQGDKPVVVDFWASWCGPCRAFAPTFATQAAENDALVFAKVDSDANPELAARYAIRSIPTLAVFIRGKLAQRISGALSAAELARWLQSVTPTAPSSA